MTPWRLHFSLEWYDQSGSAPDTVQTTAAAQPKVVVAGVLVTNNARPAAIFDDVDDYLLRSAAELYSSGGAGGIQQGCPDRGTVRMSRRTSRRTTKRRPSFRSRNYAGLPQRFGDDRVDLLAVGRCEVGFVVLGYGVADEAGA